MTFLFIFLSFLFAFEGPAFAQLSCSTTLKTKGKSSSKVPDGLISGYYEFDFGDYDNFYLDPKNKDHRELLESLGVIFTSKKLIIPDVSELARKVNLMVDQMVEEGVVTEDEAIYWADTYVLKSGQLGFVKFGEEPPRGSKFFIASQFGSRRSDAQGRLFYRQKSDETPYSMDKAASFFLADIDYVHAVSNGFGPIFRSRLGSLYTKTGLSRKYPKESILLHDLAHMSGFLSHPNMMKFFRRTSKRIANDQRSFLQRRDMLTLFRDINESAIILKEESGELLEDLFKKNRLVYESQVEEDLLNSIRTMPQDRVQSFFEELVELYNDMRLPLGGAVRTPSIAEVFDFPIDVAIDRAKIALENLKDFEEQRKTQGFLKRFKTLKQADRIRSDFRVQLARLANTIWTFSSITDQDYFDIIEKGKIRKDLHRIWCSGPIDYLICYEEITD